MRTKTTKLTCAALIALLLCGCGDVSFDLHEGEGFGPGTSQGDYTVVVPDHGEDSTSAGESVETEPDTAETSSDETTKLHGVFGKGSPMLSEDPESEEETDFPEGDDTMLEASVSDGLIPTEPFVPEVYSCPADTSRRAKTIVAAMSDEEKAAQLILARCPSENAVDLMADYAFGGYTLYAVDFADRDPDSAEEFIAEIKSSVSITPFIAVDEEGGSVVRVSKYPAYRSEPFPSPMDIYSESGIDGLIGDTNEKADLLLSLGINMNLAPVVDIAEEGDYIYPRTICSDPYEDGDAAQAIITTAGAKGLISCLKHFPGYGSNVDTHTGIAHDSRSLDDFRGKDLIPFTTALKSPYDTTVLVNHNVIECMDDIPASLSANVHRMLREEIGFDGVIITDDLGMKGIRAYSGETSPYVVGILCGNDLLCVSDPVTAYNDLIEAVNSGELSTKLLDEHVSRIIELKLSYGIIS